MPEGYLYRSIPRCAVVRCSRGKIYRFVTALPRHEHDDQVRYALPGRKLFTRESLQKRARRHGWQILDYNGVMR